MFMPHIVQQVNVHCDICGKKLESGPFDTVEEGLSSAYLAEWKHMTWIERTCPRAIMLCPDCLRKWKNGDV